MRASLTGLTVVCVSLLVVGCSQHTLATGPSSSEPSPSQFDSPPIRVASVGGAPAVVVAIKSTPGNLAFDAVLAIPHSVNIAARTGHAPFGVRVTVTYLSANNTVETFDSGPVPITSTILLAAIDAQTDAIQLSLIFNQPVPGANPSFSTTVEVVVL